MDLHHPSSLPFKSQVSCLQTFCLCWIFLKNKNSCKFYLINWFAKCMLFMWSEEFPDENEVSFGYVIWRRDASVVDVTSMAGFYTCHLLMHWLLQYSTLNFLKYYQCLPFDFCTTFQQDASSREKQPTFRAEIMKRKTQFSDKKISS